MTMSSNDAMKLVCVHVCLYTGRITQETVDDDDLITLTRCQNRTHWLAVKYYDLLALS